MYLDTNIIIAFPIGWVVVVHAFNPENKRISRKDKSERERSNSAVTTLSRRGAGLTYPSGIS